jgi:vancomycin resistance protein YoaR
MIILRRIMKNRDLLFMIGYPLSIAVMFLSCLPSVVAAAPAELTLRYQHHIFTLRPSQFPAWHVEQEEWRYDGKPFRVPQAMRMEGDAVIDLPRGVTRATVSRWDTAAIAATLQSRIAASLDRSKGSVLITRDIAGAVVFEGVGLPGRRLDVPAAAALVSVALERGIADLTLPVFEEQPAMTIVDDELRKQGIIEVVTVGESDFSGSPMARRHNIAVGLAKFNGQIIPKNSLFSFNAILGPVNAVTGYKKELVILGERTLPDFGGGLCQVSTTAYRGVWEYGFPIEDRRNHSFAVRYYGPQGTDATVYPPQTDMQFTNDTPGALLLQTYADNDKAYFIYYGTKDDRRSDVYGPYTWGRVDPPVDRSEYTTEISVGTTRKVGDRVPGVRAAWFRVVASSDDTDADFSIDPVYSVYEARPLFMQIGVAAESLLLQSSLASEASASSIATHSSRSNKARSSARPIRRRD